MLHKNIHLFPAGTPESCKILLNLEITIGSSLLQALKAEIQHLQTNIKTKFIKQTDIIGKGLFSSFVTQANIMKIW